MADPFVAEIRIFGFNFAPKGWAMCNGQILPISQNTALFALLGTMYGGDGKSTFALPDLQGRAAAHQGDFPFMLGENGGEETVTLLSTEMALHNHTANAQNQPAQNNAPGNNRVLARSVGGFAYQTDPTQTPVDMDPINSTSLTGQNLPHNNMQPYLVFVFCIALQGVFPARG